MKKLTYKTPLDKKTVLVRASLNVPFDAKQIAEHGTWRLKQSIPTIRYLIRKKCRVVIISHRGRPGGKVVPALSLKLIALTLGNMMGRHIYFIKTTSIKQIQKKVQSMPMGSIAVLENIRFHRGEESNNHQFAHELAGIGDVFINEAFSVCHRTHASIVGIPQFLPSYAGILLDQEVQALKKIKKNVKKPFIAIIGGVKLAAKLGAIEGIIKDAQYIFVAGKIANEIIYYNRGMKSRLTHDDRTIIKKMYTIKGIRTKLILPVDFVIRHGKKVKTIPTSQVTTKNSIIDIGIKTTEHYKKKLRRARTIVWNGPLGIIEKEYGASASKELAKYMSTLTCHTVVGGGETVALIVRLKVTSRFTHVSTGGGAMLEYLAQGTLPGISALSI